MMAGNVVNKNMFIFTISSLKKKAAAPCDCDKKSLASVIIQLKMS